jgi:hypothetical protein
LPFFRNRQPARHRNELAGMKINNPNSPASIAQREYLARLAHEVPGTELPDKLTKAEASALIDELKATAHVIWKVQNGYA